MNFSKYVGKIILFVMVLVVGTTTKISEGPYAHQNFNLAAAHTELSPMRGPEPIILELVVAEIRDTLRTIAENKRIDLKIEVDPALSNIVVDPRSLKQVLYNYLSNAIKFTPEGGKVAVRIKTENADRFRIEVEDSGIGIKPDDLTRLFVEFQQLDSTTTKKYPGTGLGLALTKRIVEAQGGRVGVDSAPGKGSVFHAVLPQTFRYPDASSMVENAIE